MRERHVTYTFFTVKLMMKGFFFGGNGATSKTGCNLQYAVCIDMKACLNPLTVSK